MGAGASSVDDREAKATDETLQTKNGEDMDRSGEIVVEDNESFDLSSSDEDEDGEAPKEAYANVGLDGEIHELSEKANFKLNVVDETTDTPPSADTHESGNAQLDINNDTSGDEMVIDDSDDEMVLSDGD